MPRVSVTMPVYNCAPFLRESIASVLGQTFTDFELILVDDGSTDGSWDLLQTFADQRVRAYRFEQNISVGAARNFAIEKSDCEYIAFLDADDIADRARLAVQVAYLDWRPEIGATSSPAWINDSGKF